MKTKKEIEELINEIQEENKDFQEEYNELKSLINPDQLMENIDCYLSKMDEINTIIEKNTKAIHMLQWVLTD